MTGFPKCLEIVTAEVDPEVEAEWNKWYDTVHLPAALACPGVLRASRYVCEGTVSEVERGTRRPGPARLYTTVYELTSPEAVKTKEFLAMRGWAHFAPHVRSRTWVTTKQL